MKKTCLLSLVLQLQTDFMFPTHLEAKETLPGDISWETPSLYIPLASLQLGNTSQVKSLFTCLEPQFLQLSLGPRLPKVTLTLGLKHLLSPVFSLQCCFLSTQGQQGR